MRVFAVVLLLAFSTFATAAVAVDRMVEGFPELPADARDVAERFLACQHFGGELSGTGDERDQDVTATLKKLKCDEVQKDLEHVRRKYRKDPAVLKLLDEAASYEAV